MKSSAEKRTPIYESLRAMRAIAVRDLATMLANPIGYLFILAFVAVSGLICFTPDSFYLRGIADLGALHGVMPWLLAVLVPAIGMGSWAAERERGTEEFLFTWPLPLMSAVLGKFLAVLGFYTIALVAHTANVAVLLWLGDPDLGLLAANYVGWWLQGAMLAATAVCASTCMGQSAAAFVIAAFAAVVQIMAWRSLDWFDPFARGLIDVGAIGWSLAVVLLFLLLALARLQWRREPQRQPFSGSLLALVLLAANGAQLADRQDLGIDASSEGLGSVHPAAMDLVQELQQPVTLHLYLSRHLPQSQERSAEDLLLAARALERASDGIVRVRIQRMDETVGEEAEHLRTFYDIEPVAVQDLTETGETTVEVYLAAVAESGGKRETLPFVAPGMSADYELLRLARKTSALAGNGDLPVVGVVISELDITDTLDRTTGAVTPAWRMVQDWRRSYEVRSLDARRPIPDDIDVLVVPMPSGLTPEELLHVHDSLWRGTPGLLLADPAPFSLWQQGRWLSPAFPKRFDHQTGTWADGVGKGDVDALYAALGLEVASDAVLWSAYKPQTAIRDLPKVFLWSARRGEGVGAHPITTGIDRVVTMHPGAISVLEGDAGLADMSYRRLLAVGETPAWGHQPIDALVAETPYGARPLTPEEWQVAESPPPALAVLAEGTMRRGVVDLPADASESATAAARERLGEPGPVPTRVLVINDLDLAMDDFYQLRHRVDRRLDGQSLPRTFAEVGNVPLLGNAIDVLLGREALVPLRAQGTRQRPLTRLEAIRQETEAAVRAATAAADAEVDAVEAAARAELEERLTAIEARPGYDELGRRNALNAARIAGERKIERVVQEIETEREQAIKAARSQQRATLRGHRDTVRLLAVGIPAATIFLVFLVVLVVRLLRERADIPTSRRRRSAA